MGVSKASVLYIYIDNKSLGTHVQQRPGLHAASPSIQLECSDQIATLVLPSYLYKSILK